MWIAYDTHLTNNFFNSPMVVIFYRKGFQCQVLPLYLLNVSQSENWAKRIIKKGRRKVTTVWYHPINHFRFFPYLREYLWSILVSLPCVSVYIFCYIPNDWRNEISLYYVICGFIMVGIKTEYRLCCKNWTRLFCSYDLWKS